MPYQNKILATGTVFDPEDNGVWTMADVIGDGSPGLVYIKTRNTDSRSIEVHASSLKSYFQERTLSTGTVFLVEDNGTWLMQDYTGDGKADLVYIKTRNTGTGKVEVHVADAAAGYQRFALQTGTAFDMEDDGIWTMSGKGDLVYIKTKNTGIGRVEYHVASKASNYQDLTVHEITDFDAKDNNNGTYCLAPHVTDQDLADLYFIKTSNVGDTGTVEVHAVSAKSRFKKRIPFEAGTGFRPEANGVWLMTDFTHHIQPDLAYIKTRSTVTGKVELHVSPYQDSA